MRHALSGSRLGGGVLCGAAGDTYMATGTRADVTCEDCLRIIRDRQHPDWPYTAALEYAREFVTVELLDDDEVAPPWNRLRMEPERVREALIEVLVGAVANTYEDLEDFSDHITKALAEWEES